MTEPVDLRVVPQRYEQDVAITSLTAFDRNARLHDRKRIAESITYNGWAGVIYAEDGTGRILGGHGRVDDLVERGAETVPGVIWLETEDEAHARRLLIALNPHPDDPGYDVPLLVSQLQEIVEATGTLDGTGYDEAEMAEMLEGIDKAVPEAPESFPEFDQTISYEHQCPKCGYKWSGKSQISTGGE